VSPVPPDCFFLSADHVRQVHREALARFGGLDGVRDVALLESAVAAPRATFGGDSLYADLVDVAAAYLFYLCRNHPFLDDNKRTALGSCLLFLLLNGLEPRADGPRWEALTVDIASARLTREEATDRLRSLVKPS
jgi:death-on-curing protein